MSYRMYRYTRCFLLSMVVLFFPKALRATTTNFNANFFVPAIAQQTYFQAHNTQTLYQFQFAGAFLADYGYRPFQINQGGARLQGVIDHVLVQHAMLSFGVFDFLQIGVDFPYVFVNKFQNPNVVPGLGTSNQKSFGDMRVEVKARLLDINNFPVGLALTPFVTIPTGKSEYYIADLTYTGGAILSFEARALPRLSFLLNVGYQGGEEVLIRNIHYQHRFLVGGGGNVRLGKSMNVFVEGNTWTDLKNNFFKTREESPVEILAGFGTDLGTSGFSVKAGGGTCGVCGGSGARVRALVAANYRFNPGRFQQQDRVRYATLKTPTEKSLTPEVYTLLQQNCPVSAEEFDPHIHDVGCPKYYELKEVADLYFRCPPPEEFDPKIHDASCEKVFALGTSYSDAEVFNIVNLSTSEMEKKCPSDPEAFDPRVHDVACQKYYTFSENIALAEKCPGAKDQFDPEKHDPKCMKYFQLQHDYEEDQWAVLARLARQDSDKDGMKDYQDQCPHESEDMNGFADDDGCPEGNQKQAVLSGSEIVTLEPVYFDFDKAILRTQAYAILDQVSDFIDQNKWIQHIRVEGHADNVGDRVVNARLSRFRAQVVIDYLKRRLARSDLKFTAVGYGAKEPMLPNTSAENRAKNRRVVFTIVTKGK